MLNAMSHAARGIPVFPIIPDDKRPLGSLVPNGFKDRSRNPEVIRAWWSDCPRANIGIVPADQELVVVDVDLGADPALEARLPPTMVVRTPSGGRHHYFDSFAEFGNAKLAHKIDIRSAAGYVLAPGSSVNGKLYTLETQCKPAWLPKWVSDALAAPAQKPARERTDGPPVSEDELGATLSRIDPACGYDDWARTLAAISATPCDGDLAAVALDWSLGRLGDWGTPANACGDDYDDMETKLGSFQREDGVTYATLLYLANLNNSAIPKEWQEEVMRRKIEAQRADLTDVELAKLAALKAALPPIQNGERSWPRDDLTSKTLEQLIESMGGAAQDETPISEPVELPNLKFATSKEPKMIRWLWNGWLAQGKLHLLGGAPQAGKSSIAFDFAATISRGGEWPDGSPAPRGRVMIWSSEDDWDDTILPRLIAASAGLDRVRLIDKIGTRTFNPAEDVRYLYEAAKAFPDLKLLILDPILNVIKASAKETAQTRQDLTPIVTFARETGIGVLGITHFTKNSEQTDPLDRFVGSGATGAYARVALAAARVDNSETRKLVRVKSNIGPVGGGFEYRLEQRPLEGYEHMNAQHVAWGGRLTGNARDLLSDEAKRSALSDANDFLDEQLANGAVQTSVLKSGAEANCISWETIKRAKGARKDILVTTAGPKSTWRLAEDHTAEAF
jgi:hypothetical protein